MPPEPRTDERVCFVLHSFDLGGSGRVAAYLTQGFVDRGVKAELIVIGRGGRAQAMIEALVRPDVPIRYLDRISGNRPFDLVRNLFRLAAYLRTRNPDAVIAAANNVALVTAMAMCMARLARSRLYLKTTNPVASSRHRGTFRAVRRFSYRLAFRRATAVWTLSADESEDMRQAFPQHRDLFRDVANPYVTPAMLASEAEEPAPRGEGKLVICVARLEPQKRLERLIEAFAHVRTAGSRMLILGEGQERAALVDLVDRLGLADRIAMPGFSNAIPRALHAADLFVLTSDYEGLPAVLLEAMAVNCPVLTTDCFPAARSLIARAEGFAIIEDHAPMALAAQIDRHLAMPRPRGLRAIAEAYSIDSGIASHFAASRK